MYPNNPGDPSYPTDPSNPPAYPQQPGQPGYGQQPPAYPPQPGQPPAYPPQPPTYPQQPGQPQYAQQPPSYPQQPGQYPPPVYNQAPPPSAPPYGQPQQPKKSSKKGWIIGCSIAAVVVLLACSGIGVALIIGAQKASDAVKSTGQAAAASFQITLFCTDIQLQDYDSAYALLSKSAQGHTSQSDYATHQQAIDTSDGDVTTCTVDANHPLPSVSGNTATAQVQVARGEDASPTTGSVKLVFENDEWKIDSADSSLKLL